jgi:primosomal protein N' (replication factor Y)
VDPELLGLARWMSDYYCCPLGMVLTAMIPAAVKTGTGARTVERVRRAEVSTADAAVIAQGLRPLTKRAWEAITARDAADFPIDARELAARIGASNAGPVNQLVRAGLMEVVRVETVRAAEAFWEVKRVEGVSSTHELTDEQHAAVEGIGQAIAGMGEPGVHLLHGVTGSGKTEVYLALIAGVLDAGGTALVLVPEIGLTPQTAGRFIDRFGADRVAVLHSGLSAGQRHRQWARAAGGQARVVVGARSAVFAPLSGLGLIVVDEEHATDYKQDQLPRYHARDVAIVRGARAGCPVVLGSATPSLESYANARRGRYRVWRLTRRVPGASLPQVRVVDMTHERATGLMQRDDVIGPTLGGALERCVKGGWQSILLLNRRGVASYVACASAPCGWSLRCERCEASMVVHGVRGRADRRIVRCHHCGAECVRPVRCPQCAGRLVELGSGTQRVEEEIERRFGASLGLVRGRTFERVDSDSVASGPEWFELLRRFGAGELRVLVGTQMLAKGLDFPGVRLVGVLSADTALALPDFRAAERTFQLVAQVAGRAGRGERAGAVVVQTLRADEPSIVLAARHDYEAFAAGELALRAEHELPPAWRMARVVVRDKDHDKARAGAAGLAAEFVAAGDALARSGGRVRVGTPSPCAVARVAEFYRWEVEVTAPTAGELLGVLRAVRRRGLLKSDARTAVDVDPVSGF